MAGGYVKKILDPQQSLDVLREVPIVTGDLGKTHHPITANRYSKDLLSPKQRNYVAAGVPAKYDYLHVSRADRVSYFDLIRDDMPSKHLRLHLEAVQLSATVQTGKLFKTAKSLRPIFYLPFQMNKTTRMKLEADAGHGGQEVQFFATATIDGCSVYIEGPPAAPKVSHLNASNVAPANAGESEAAKLARVQQKSAAMDVRLGRVKKGVATVIERKDYIADTAAGQTMLKTGFANRKHIAPALVLDYQPFGAVVGVKNAGTWTFYLQKCGRFRYTDVARGKDVDEFMVLEARECWPNGGGVFRTLP